MIFKIFKFAIFAIVNKLKPNKHQRKNERAKMLFYIAIIHNFRMVNRC